MTAPFPQPLLDALGAAPERPAFEHAGRSVTRAQVLETIRRLAGVLHELGLGPGRALAVFTAVTPEAFAAHIAAHTLGCRVVGVRPGYADGQLVHVLGMDVDALLVDATTLTPALAQAAGAARLLSLGTCQGALDLLAQPDTGRGLAVAGRPDDIALLTFTSGSTGQPKGCALSYGALATHWSWQEPRLWSPVARELADGFERYLLFGTLASMVVLEFLALCLQGSGVAVIPELDARAVFPYAIARYRITGSIITVPRLCQMLDLLRDDAVDVSSLRALMVSGSPITPRHLAAAVARLGPVVYQGYGQTETGSLSMLTPGDIAREPEQVLSSVGRPHPGVELRVRDERGRALGPGHTGEIHVRSPYLMTRYWGDPEETRDTLRDGWLRTRDLGQLDQRGFLHLSGRTRDVIMVHAMVVYAGPIEQVLASHPEIDQAYVAGAPDERSGEAVHAFIVPVQGRRPDHAALRALVRSQLGTDSVPATITEVASVPVAASGKPDKRALLGQHVQRVPR
jgi:fatty-acyl-CoA synthase